MRFGHWLVVGALLGGVVFQTQASDGRIGFRGAVVEPGCSTTLSREQNTSTLQLSDCAPSAQGAILTVQSLRDGSTKETVLQAHRWAPSAQAFSSGYALEPRDGGPYVVRIDYP